MKVTWDDYSQYRKMFETTNQMNTGLLISSYSMGHTESYSNNIQKWAQTWAQHLTVSSLFQSMNFPI
jgi:hypothetical protein